MSSTREAATPVTVPSKTFDVRYARLNPEQKEAVDTIEGPVMVIAGPGTGKTTVLTLRIANILRMTDTPASGILAITFTDAGVKAMRMKLREVIGSRADEVRIHTFHGFAAFLIAEFQDHFPHLERTRQMTDIDTESMIRKILTDARFAKLRPFGNPDFYVSKIVSSLSDAKREALTPEMVRSYAREEKKRIQDDPESISTRGASKGKLKAEAEKAVERCERTELFADVYAAYEDMKRVERLMDFDDLIIELLKAFREDELLLRLVQERLLYIHVDEHQDTNDSQNFLVRMLADFFDAPNLFVVGDEKQAIYRFQGASVDNFLRFKNAWRGMKTIRLTENYRSHQHILDGAFSMIERNYDEGEHADLRVRLLAKGEAPLRPIDAVFGKDGRETLRYLSSAVRKIMENEKESTVAVITKTNRDLERIIRTLEGEGIPVSSERKVDIWNHPAGNLFFLLAEFLADPSRVDALAKTAAVGLWDLSFDGAAAFIRDLKSGRCAPESLPSLRRIRAKLVEEGALAFLVFSASESGYLARIANDPASVEVWRGIIELSESLIRESDIRDPSELLRKLLAYKASAGERSVKVRVGAPEYPVRAMTAHGSKGLEFDHVFIPFATEESWMGRARASYFVFPTAREDGEEERDVRRLFYVALTRAKKHATILVPAEEAGGKAQTPLRFLEEMDAASVNTVTLSGSSSENEILSGSMSTPGSETRIIDAAKTMLAETGLSVTALNHFLKCPSSFMYQSVLKIPQAPAASTDKGNAVHEALSRIWREDTRSREVIERILIETVSSYFERSFLPSFEKEAVRKELLEEAPRIARALEAHFSARGEVRTEMWSEGSFEASYMGESICVPVHGKLDAVVDSGREVMVFDYKTREAMTAAAIKGETKSSDGGYFRQLVFYKFLIENDLRFKGKPVFPSLVFVMPNNKGECATVGLPISEDDVQKLRTQIQGLVDSVWSGAFVRAFCADEECVWCRLRRLAAF